MDWFAEELDKVETDALDNTNLSVAIFGLHYQPDEDLWQKLIECSV